MQNAQNSRNPDVNDFEPNVDPGEEKGSKHDQRTEIEKDHETDSIPLPPDVEDRNPVELPARGDDEPVGDVDDSPKRIA